MHESGGWLASARARPLHDDELLDAVVWLFDVPCELAAAADDDDAPGASGSLLLLFVVGVGGAAGYGAGAVDAAISAATSRHLLPLIDAAVDVDAAGDDGDDDGAGVDLWAGVCGANFALLLHVS